MILSFDWGYLIVGLLGLIFLRILFRRLLRFRIISIETGVFAGVTVFLLFPLTFNSSMLYIPPHIFLFYIWGGYLAFLFGQVISRNYANNLSDIKYLKNIPAKSVQLALWVVLIVTIYRMIDFFVIGGLTATYNFWIYGQPHLTFLDQIGSQLGAISGSFSNFFETAIRFIFVACWGLIFKKYTKFAFLSWYLYWLPASDVYMGRSTYIGLFLIPIICYWIFRQVKLNKLIIQMLVLLVPLTIFFAWLGSVRINSKANPIGISTNFILNSLIDSTSRSPIRATYITYSNIHANPFDYLVGMISQPIPRFLWANKPWIDGFNQIMTYIYTGLPISRSNTINTFTVFGEGWYYFGSFGPLIIMFMLGLISRSFEYIYSNNDLFLASYVNLIYLSFIQIRSTFYNFYVYGLNMILVVIVLCIVLKISYGEQRKDNEMIASPIMQ